MPRTVHPVAGVGAGGPHAGGRAGAQFPVQGALNRQQADRPNGGGTELTVVARSLLDLERFLAQINVYGETRTSIVFSTPIARRGIQRPRTE